MQTADTSYQHFGLIAFAILLCGLGFLAWRWPQGKHRTFSQHVAVSKNLILYYILLFSIVLPVLLLFFVHWFVPTFHLSQWFIFFIAVSSATQYACTLIPEVGGWRTKLHQILAGISAICLLPPLVFLLNSDTAAFASKLVTIACLAAMLTVLIIVVCSRGKRSDSLILQSSYFTAFFAAILTVNYS